MFLSISSLKTLWSTVRAATDWSLKTIGWQLGSLGSDWTRPNHSEVPANRKRKRKWFPPAGHRWKTPGKQLTAPQPLLSSHLRAWMCVCACVCVCLMLPLWPRTDRGQRAPGFILLGVNCCDRALRGPSLALCPWRSRDAALILSVFLSLPTHTLVVPLSHTTFMN